MGLQVAFPDLVAIGVIVIQNNVKNFRKRCSLLIQRFENNGVTNVLIDTTPDMRQQLLDAKIGKLDAVIYTHEHADHLHGLDDLRMIVINMQNVFQYLHRNKQRILFLSGLATPLKHPKEVHTLQYWI